MTATSSAHTSMFSIGRMVAEAGAAVAEKAASPFQALAGGSDYGLAVERDGVLVWSRLGRPLSVYELRMRPKRGDLWLSAFDGVYRLRLSFPAVCEAERDFPLGVLWSGIPADGQMPANPNVPLIAYRKLIRAGLVGGGAAIVRGEQVAVDPAAAEALVAQLDRQPVAETWRIARPLLEASTMGRDATPAELAAFTIGGPDTIIVPDWAWGDAA